MHKGLPGERVISMVSLISLQAFAGLSLLVAVALYVVYRRTDMSSAILAAIGAGILALYLLVAITVDLVDVI